MLFANCSFLPMMRPIGGLNLQAKMECSSSLKAVMCLCRFVNILHLSAAASVRTSAYGDWAKHLPGRYIYKTDDQCFSYFAFIQYVPHTQR